MVRRCVLSVLVSVLLGATSFFAQAPVFTPLLIASGSLTTANTNQSGASTCLQTNTACVVIDLGSSGGVSVQITGTWAGTRAFEISSSSPSDTAPTWVAWPMTPSSSVSTVTSTTANGYWTANVAGTMFRVRTTVATSGTSDVKIVAIPARPVSSAGSGSGTGTVESVDVAVPGGFSSSGGPITGTGTITISANGTSGGVPCYTAANTMASSAALGAGLPVVGGGAGACVGAGTRSGNTTAYVTTTGAQTSGDCVKIDANGNHVANGSACGGAGGSPGGSDTQVQFNDSSSFGGDAGLTFNKTTNVLTATGKLISAGLQPTYVTKTANYTLTDTDGTVQGLTNAFTLTLPTAVGIQGRIYVLVNAQTANTITIDGNAAETVCGSGTYALLNTSIIIQSDNANWQCLASLALPLSGLTSGGVIYATSSTGLASSALLAQNGIVNGGGAGTAPFTVAGLVTDGVSKITVGEAGTSAGALIYKNATSGSITYNPPAGALGAITRTLLAANGTEGVITGSITTNNCAKFDASSRLVDAGTTCGGGGGGTVYWAEPQGLRLSAQNNVYNSTSDQTAAGTIYLTPRISGGKGTVTCYNGSALEQQSIAQKSLALTATSGSVYNVYYDCDGAALALGAAWTNTTTPSETLADELGAPVLSSDHTKLYMGVLMASASNVTEDSLAKRYLWNRWNQLERSMRVQDTTDSWTYNSTTLRQARAQATNQVDAVFGELGLSAVVVWVAVSCDVPAVTQGITIAIGIDGTTATTTAAGASYVVEATGTVSGRSGIVKLHTTPAAGRHFYTWLEAAQTTNGNVTFYGDAGGAVGGTVNSGIFGSLWN